jgi:hypothetical protein
LEGMLFVDKHVKAFSAIKIEVVDVVKHYPCMGRRFVFRNFISVPSIVVWVIGVAIE